MKRNRFAALAAAGLLLAGLTAALAAPASESDPLVGLAYLNETYIPQVQGEILQRIQAGTAQTYADAQSRLEELVRESQAQPGQTGGTGADASADSFAFLTLNRDDQVSLTTGASLMLQAGASGLELSAGVLVDVTAGQEAGPGSTLTAGRRYVLAENSAAKLTIRSDAASLAVQGPYSLASLGTPQTPFTDLCSTDWYYESARYAYEHDLFQGISETEFYPGGPMTRAMLATVLSRMAGIQNGGTDAGFTDVPKETWYTAAVNWAANAGVVNGMGDGRFLPEASITREQMAVMLYRYAGSYLGRDVSARGALSGFSDRSAVSDWAEEALAWAVGAGLFNGDESGALLPGGAASRAEVAALLQRFSLLV